jgi:anthranilate phosphoribosyltransferase
MEGIVNPEDFGVSLLSQSEIEGGKQLKNQPKCLLTSEKEQAQNNVVCVQEWLSQR